MPTLKLELFKSKLLADGRYPVCIRVTHKGTQKRKSIASAFPKEWDEKNMRIKARSRKDFEQVNRDIEDAFIKYSTRFKDLKNSGDDWSADDVFKEVKISSPLFKVNALAYLRDLELKNEAAAKQVNGKIKGNHSVESARSRLEKIMRYVGEQDFKISDIDDKWLAGFKLHCKTKEKSMSGGLGNSDNTINYAIKFIRRICSYTGIVPEVFNKVKISFTKTVKQKLTLEEVIKIQELELPEGTTLWHSRNIFLLSIYFRGMRIGDILQLEYSDIKGGRLFYDSSKTGHEYDLKIIPQAQAILDLYPQTDKKRPYVFPLYTFQYNDSVDVTTNVNLKTKQLKGCTALINGNLKKVATLAGIEKNISTHIARHTFASISDKKLGGNLKAIQHLLGHGSRRMTEIYINDLRQTDEMDMNADAVFG